MGHWVSMFSPQWRTGLGAIAALAMVLCATPQVFAQKQSLVPATSAMSDAEARLELARLLARHQSTLAQSEAEYRRVLATGPGDTKIITELADVLVRMRRYPDALRLLDPLAGAARPRPEVLVLLGDIRLYSGDVPGAALAYGRAYASAPAMPGLELKLAQTLSWSGRPREALPLLERLHATRPENADVAVLLARTLAATGNGERASRLLAALLEKQPESVEFLLTAADIQAGRDRALEAKALFERAINLDPSGKALAEYGDRSIIWGDFHRAEDTVRAEIAAKGNTPALRRKLASVLLGEQRYEEASEIYESLLSADSGDEEAMAGLGRLLLLEKNPSAALDLAGRLSRMSHDSSGVIEALRLEAQSKADLRDLKGALAAADKAVNNPGATAEDYARLGDLLFKTESREKGLEAYRRAAAMDPPSLWAAWRSGGEEDSALPSDPTGMAEIASRLKDSGRFEKSGRFYRMALKRDPGNFAARMGLAELLASTGWHDQALALLDGLASDLPGVSKVLLARARVLGWAKRYDESLSAYDELHRLKPEDPVPLREAARTAFWGKMPGRGALYYAELEGGNHPSKVRETAKLERTAKTEGFHRRFSRAIETNDKLLAAEPGNQEALFDRAQAACAMGLCDEEKSTYERLLAIDPLHTLAGKALDRLRWRTAPSLRAAFSVWDEDGKSGRLAQITRYRWDIEATVPVEGRYYLRATQHLWLEDPKTPPAAQQNQGGPSNTPASRFVGAYLAEGQTVGAGGRVNEWFSGDFSFTNKQYFDAGLSPLYSGLARIEVNLRDYARFALFYQRTDELTNNMSLAQGVQIDNWGSELRLQPVRRVDMSFQGRFQNYSDGNQGAYLQAGTGVVITDHPHELKLTATGEYRDTAEQSRYLYSGSSLVNIIHPYWTPQKYLAGGLTLGWRHDLAKEFFCGARQHFYAVQLSGGTDTDRNPYWRLEAEYANDITDRWSFSLKGLVHRSQQWDALGAWTGLSYRF